ncbi:MAG: hypothetical protein Q9M91_02785 [Candidatus Dojkabacteria bacterium]|nr:hypothetical protein [Candidatus Dojkabacteria bacterium]MDQ7020750.1 hypothetical protein [Candidatus Dojkabacteria bacterium]
MTANLKESPERSFLDVVLERIPPVLGYLMLLFPIFGSFYFPNIVGVYLIIIFVYFFYKSFTTSIQFAIGLWKIREDSGINWDEVLEGFENPVSEITKLQKQLDLIKRASFATFNREDLKDGVDDLAVELKYSKKTRLPKFYKKILFFFEKRKSIKYLKKRIKNLKKSDHANNIKPSEIQHILILPFVTEPIDLLQSSIDKLMNQSFNTKQINIVLAAEAGIEGCYEVGLELKKRNEKYFNNIWVTNHKLEYPDAIGKSANMNYASREVYKHVKELGWDLKKTTITSCDADSKIDPQYFANVTYRFITDKNSEYKIYVGALVFYNNIWRLPFYARVKNSFSSIYNVSKLIRSDRLIPVSTYTTSFWMIKSIDFWTPWITPEDYHIFFKALFTFDKHVSAVPIYLITMSDSAEGNGHIDTIMNNYKQSRRWAWGISDNGWMLKEFFRNFFKHSLRTKYKVMHAIFDHITGPNIAILILVGGHLPGILNPTFANEVTGTMLPAITSFIVKITFIFLVAIIFLDFYLKPRPDVYPWWKRIARVLEWFIQPLVGFFLAALPGIESQTRLMFGQYMEYYVTAKKDDKGNEAKKDTRV